MKKFTLIFLSHVKFQNDLWDSLSASVYIVVFALNDASSFQGAKRCLLTLNNQMRLTHSPVILVANKSDAMASIKRDLYKGEINISCFSMQK